jgi:hypothetical protein
MHEEDDFLLLTVKRAVACIWRDEGGEHELAA